MNLRLGNVGKYEISDRCLAAPEFCLNGGTCEITMTGARCHCTDRFLGDRCDQCSEGFQGDQYDSCAHGYYGDKCGKRISHY